MASRLREFARERDWEQFHTPKNLSMALAVEAAELMELFQWAEGGHTELSDDERARASQEMADVLIYLVRMADVLDVDLIAAAAMKIAANALKYPADRVRGRSQKYDRYEL
ncbi:MAG: nucleotide pyrophosphohydrolase [Gemmatimonadota bacterium]